MWPRMSGGMNSIHDTVQGPYVSTQSTGQSVFLQLCVMGLVSNIEQLRNTACDSIIAGLGGDGWCFALNPSCS